MSFKSNNCQQFTLNDSYINLSAGNQRIAEHSLAKDFDDIVFPAINEERLSVLYSDNNAFRANTPVNYIIGALILMEQMSLNEEQLMESMCCDVRFQYALHATHYQEQPVSERTFSRFRECHSNYRTSKMKTLQTLYRWNGTPLTVCKVFGVF